MFYTSTRNNQLRLDSKEAMLKGLSEEGGLFVPMAFPKFDADLRSFSTYTELAKAVFDFYLTDFDQAAIDYCVDHAYDQKFDTPAIAPLFNASDRYFLELYHGPTSAFKDMALSILPYFLTEAIKSSGEGKEVVILTATSGDTGKAALEGFANTPNTRIVVYYPKDGVSPTQERQMCTTEGDNTLVVGVHGNFDDCQRGVKTLLGDAELKADLDDKGFRFSSANSINVGRLLPQIVYYFYAYKQLLNKGDVVDGEAVNFVVPTGNFGNILAGYYAKAMGLPIHKLICASNENNVLADFINTGVYDRNRTLHLTTSPSMDILVSSNLERYLYHLSNEDDKRVNELMHALQTEGRYALTDEERSKMDLYGGYASEERVRDKIAQTFMDERYLIDPHTAVASLVYDDYLKETKDLTKTVILSTASPYKFSETALSAIGVDIEGLDPFEAVKALMAETKTTAPIQIIELETKEICHDGVVDVASISEPLIAFLQEDIR